MKAVIPIAGKGTRFLPATKQTAKELIPILNTPMLHYVVQEAVASGIRQIIFVTSSAKREVENFYDRNLELEQFLEQRGKTQELKLVREIGSMVDVVAVRQKEQLGLGHAILCARGLIGEDENFVVLLGDEMVIGHKTPAIRQLMDISQKHDGATTLGVVQVSRKEVSRYGVIEGKEITPHTFRMSGMVEKPPAEKAPTTLIASGRYVLPGKIFHLLQQTPRGADGELQLTAAVNKLCQDQGETVLAHRFSGERHDTGNLEGYLNATLELALQDDKLGEYTLNLIKDKVQQYG